MEVRGGSPAIMLAGMEGSNLGIWCVDGTGAAAASAVALVHLLFRRTDVGGLKLGCLLRQVCARRGPLLLPGRRRP